MRKRRRSVSKRVVVLLTAVLTIIGGAISGSVAWLADTASSVTTTFAVGKVTLSLANTAEPMLYTLNGAAADENTLRMVPGTTLEINDPPVTVHAGSEDCYLFVKIEESIGSLPEAPFKHYLHYSVNAEWTEGQGDGIPQGVYFRKVERQMKDQVFEIIKDHQVQVSIDLTNAHMALLEQAGATLPTLSFSAYAIQAEGFSDAPSAWEALSSQISGAAVPSTPISDVNAQAGT